MFVLDLRTVFSVLLSCLEVVVCGWQDNIRPNMFLQPRHSDFQVSVRLIVVSLVSRVCDPCLFVVQLFRGNDTVQDHFSVVLVSGHHLLVGARNVVYKLDTRDMREQQQLGWTATEQDRNVCLVKGKTENSCQNYIKVAMRERHI